MASNTGSDSLTPSERVIEAIAEEEGASPVEIPCLFDAIDPSALDEVLLSMDSGGHVSFQYNGFEVTVNASHRVSIRQRDGE